MHPPPRFRSVYRPRTHAVGRACSRLHLLLKRPVTIDRPARLDLLTGLLNCIGHVQPCLLTRTAPNTLLRVVVQVRQPPKHLVDFQYRLGGCEWIAHDFPFCSNRASRPPVRAGGKRPTRPYAHNKMRLTCDDRGHTPAPNNNGCTRGIHENGPNKARRRDESPRRTSEGERSIGIIATWIQLAHPCLSSWAAQWRRRMH